MIQGRNGVFLERFVRRDLPNYVQAVNKPQINDGAYFDGPISEDIAAHWYEKHVDPKNCGSDHFFTLLNAERDYQGTLWLWNYAGRMPGYELSIILADPNLFGKSIGTNACKLGLEFCFTYTPATRVWLTVGVENVRAIRAYANCGFKEEGVIRQFVVRGTQKHDARLMAVLRDEWVKENS